MKSSKFYYQTVWSLGSTGQRNTLGRSVTACRSVSCDIVSP